LKSDLSHYPTSFLGDLGALAVNHFLASSAKSVGETYCFGANKE
jgi:hypothetical protein